VEVSSRRSYGTGCLIAPGLILTARHVAAADPNDVVQVRAQGCTDFVEAEVVWEDNALDAALLKADRNVVGAGLPVVRFGEIVCDYADRRAVCTMTGFPRAMRRTAPGGAHRVVDDLKTVDGRIVPDTGSRSQLYAFEIDGSKPPDATKWQGISGAGVFCGGVLIGLVRIVDRDWDSTLLVLPLSHLTQAEGFARTITAHTGMPPRLQPADLQQLLSTAPDPVLSSSHLLDPRSQVVGNHSTSDLIKRIERWCLAPQPMDVTVLTGLGGTGKTRLITEVLNHMSASRPDRQPWSGGFLAEKPTHRDYAMLGSGTYPLLIAVDLAETRISQIRDVATVLSHRHRGDRVRIVLLARSAGNWWEGLRRHLRSRQIGPVSDIFQVTSDEALGDSSPEDVYVDAKAAFAARIRLLQHAGHGDGTWVRPVVADAPRRFAAGIEDSYGQPVIYHHIAALADVLAHANPDFALRDDPMDVLLGNEENYLYRIAKNHLPEGALDTKLIRTLVVAQSLAGARTVAEAAAAIQAGFHAHHHAYGAATALESPQVRALDTILATAYPATDGAHWGSMGGPLAQALLTEVESDSGNEFVEQFLRHDDLADDQCRQALSTIAHTAQEKPELAAAAQRAVAAAPQRLLPLAATAVATELRADQAQQWLAGVKSAVVERARQRAADPGIYQWAADYLAQVPQHPASDPDDQRKFSGLIDAVLTQEPATSTAEVHRHDESEPSAATPRTLLVKTQVSWPIRLLATLLAACHLVLVVGATSSAIFSDSLRQEGWSRWMYLVLTFSANIAVPVLYGAARPSARDLVTWIWPLFVITLDTSFAVLAHLATPEPFPLWVLWPVIFSAGLYTLTFAWLIWIGQLRTDPDPDQSASA